METEAIELNGQRIVVVEDDYMQASALCKELRGLGATVLGPAPTAYYAEHLIGPPGRNRVHAAVLDLHLHGATVFKLADTLQERGIPFVFATGYNRDVIPKRFADVPYFSKPLRSSQIAERLRTLVRKPRSCPVRSQETQLAVSTEEPVVVFARALARSFSR